MTVVIYVELHQVIIFSLSEPQERKSSAKGTGEISLKIWVGVMAVFSRKPAISAMGQNNTGVTIDH